MRLTGCQADCSDLCDRSRLKTPRKTKRVFLNCTYNQSGLGVFVPDEALNASGPFAGEARHVSEK